MAGYLLTRRARRDILEIWQYIARDSEQSADKFLSKLIDRFSMLGQNPRAGRQRDDIRPGIRGFPFGDYEILYRIGAPGVRISDIIHGRRDLSKMRRR
ncbi:MAG: type II toxin-antitoxin system RelE/ParE family toxin [Bryobacteraceae bacterium]